MNKKSINDLENTPVGTLCDSGGVNRNSYDNTGTCSEL
jgi:hypothetical protein